MEMLDPEEMRELGRQILLNTIADARKDVEYWREKARTHEADLANAHEYRRKVEAKLASVEAQLRHECARDLRTELEDAQNDLARIESLLNDVSRRYDNLLDEYREVQEFSKKQGIRISGLESFISVIRMYPSTDYPELRAQACNVLLGARND